MKYTMTKTILPVAVAVLIGIAGCSPPEETATASPSAVVNSGRTVRVETRPVATSTFTDVIELTGAVAALDDATISSQTAGTLVWIAELGTNVRAGTIVARIDPGMTDAAVQQAEAQVTAAEAQFNLARDTYQRQEPLFRDSVISALEFDGVRTQRNQAEAQLKQAKALLAQASEQARYTRIAAPFAGRVELHFAETGEQVVPGARVVRVVNTRRVKITMGVPERYAGDIKAGTPVSIKLASYGMQGTDEKVSFVGSVIDRASRTFPIEVELANPDGRLKPEMIAKVLVTRDRLENVVVVPLAAVIRDENGTNVFVASNEDGRKVARRQSVIVGPTYSGQAVLESGLSPGEELVVAGQNLLTPGDALEIIGAPPAPANEGQTDTSTALTSTR